MIEQIRDRERTLVELLKRIKRLEAHAKIQDRPLTHIELKVLAEYHNALSRTEHDLDELYFKQDKRSN